MCLKRMHNNQAHRQPEEKGKVNREQQVPLGRRKRKMIIAIYSVLSVLVCSLLLGLLVVLINSPGTLPPLKDEQGKVIPGSISEKVWIDVGGMKQGLFIRGENPDNPVLLYLHGGPGTPMLQFIAYMEKMEKKERIEKYFTVCYWDQRGSGMTYSKSTDPSTMTIAQMVEDTHEVTDYLKSRFGQNKIYLLGHSWGSYLGVKTVEKYPKDYLAYIGIGQVSNFVESERLSYFYMLNHAKEINDTDAVEKLERFDPYAEAFPLMPEEEHLLDYLLVRTELLNRYGIGHIHRTELLKGMSFNGMVLRTLFSFRGYTLREKVYWFLGADFSMINVFPLLLKDDLFVSSVKFEIPFYIIQGAFDYQVSQVLAEEYLEAIEAPRKGFFMMENSAHSPNLEEPEKFIEIIRKIASEVRNRS